MCLTSGARCAAPVWKRDIAKTQEEIREIMKRHRVAYDERYAWE
jgi:hypothetical protein